jgi:polyribonucleotide 5'-hydroxyl-kinase
MGQERLHSELTRDLRGNMVGDGEGGRPIQVWKLPKSGGVVERTPDFRRWGLVLHPTS